MILPQAFQRTLWRPSRAHIVFGVDFKEAALRTLGDDGREVIWLETRPGDAAERQGKAEGNGPGSQRPVRRVHVVPPLFWVCDNSLCCQIGLSEPCLPPGSSMLAQVPP